MVLGSQRQVRFLGALTIGAGGYTLQRSRSTLALSSSLQSSFVVVIAIIVAFALADVAAAITVAF
jgi:hypothetical protein